MKISIIYLFFAFLLSACDTKPISISAIKVADSQVAFDLINDSDRNINSLKVGMLFFSGEKQISADSVFFEDRDNLILVPSNEKKRFSYPTPSGTDNVQLEILSITYNETSIHED